MDIRDAQRDVREAHLDGAPGMVASGMVWLAMAAIAARGQVREAMIGLFLGGMLIFPLGSTITRLLGGSARLSRSNPLFGLALQAAFIVPLGWPLVVAAGRADVAWYFPAAALLVAVHYFPFMTLYGMTTYGVLAGALIAAAWACLRFAPGQVAAAAWATGGIEVAAGFVLLLLRQRRLARRVA
jgi:hypothetical protein